MTRRPSLEVLGTAPGDEIEGVLDVPSFLAQLHGQPRGTAPRHDEYNAMLVALAALDAREVRMANTLFTVGDLKRAWLRGGAA